MPLVIQLSSHSFFKLFRRYLPILLLLFFTFSFLYSSDQSFNQDLGRHLKLGEIIWATHQIPHVNLFSYTFPGFSFVNHHWLFEVLVYLLSSALGIHALLVMKVIVLLLAVTLTLLVAKRVGSIFFFPVSFIFLHMLRGRIDLRPEIFSFLFTIITFTILEKYEKSDTKFIYILPLISMVWVNSHIYFPLGIFLQLIFVFHFLILRFVQKQKGKETIKKLKTLTGITILSVLSSILNPNWFKGLLYPFTVFSNYGVTIAENQTITTLQATGFVNPDFLFMGLCLMVIGLAFFVGLMMSRVTFKNIAILGLGIVLACQSIRGFPYLFFLSLPIVLVYLQFKKETLWSNALSGFFVLLLFIESFYYLSGIYYQVTYRNPSPVLVATEDAKPALDFLLLHKLPQPIFNNFDIGSYIIYRTFPDYQVYVDGRPEAYPASFLQQTYLPMQEDYKIFEQEEKKYGFKTVIFSIADQNPATVHFLKSIIHDAAWDIVYLDYFMIILVKHDVTPKLHVSEIKLDTLDARNYTYSQVVQYTYLSTFLYNMNYYDKAKKINQKALDLVPDNPSANRVMANILLRDERPNLNRVYYHLSKSKNKVFW